jgi:peptidoglycan hydrolase-like protein with peptidoglycan-binding domain
MRRTALNANTYVNDNKGAPKVDQRVDQYGFEVGGPIRKEKTYFMFALERFAQVDPNPILGTVPTAAQRAGDFSQTFRPNGKLNTIYDPLTIRPNPAFDPSKKVSLTNLEYLEDPFPGNMIPSMRFDSVAMNVLQDLPLPNQPGDPITGVNNFFNGENTTLNHFQNMIARVDQTFSPITAGAMAAFQMPADSSRTPVPARTPIVRAMA